MDIIGTLLQVAKSLFDVRGKLRTAKVERRGRIAALFEQISRCIADVVTSLRDGQVPHGRCAEMKTYAEELPDLVDEELGREKAEDLGNKLASAYEVEMLLGQLKDAPDRDEQLAKLDQTSGIFLGLANTVRAA